MSRIKFWVKIHVLSKDLSPNLNQKDLASVFKSNSTRIEYFPSMKRILARIAISQIQPFSNFAGIRNRFLYQICHFRFLEILAPIFHHSSFPHITQPSGCRSTIFGEPRLPQRLIAKRQRFRLAKRSNPPETSRSNLLGSVGIRL